ncbi:MAG: beta-galactosidase [Candidatus Hydrogenedentes bacterium]|nr:beta-galactosidase [Candidatus Hydrogenedentota bacterium]
MKRFLVPFVFIAFVIVCATLGILFGKITDRGDAFLKGQGALSGKSATDELGYPGNILAATLPQVYFYANAGAAADLDLVMAEIEMAAGAGVHRHILSIPLPWQDAWAACDEVIARALAADPGGVLYLDLDLNPPAAWLAEHPDETASERTQGQPYVSVASTVWLETLRARLAALNTHLQTLDQSKRIAGWVLSALEEGRWYRTSGYDRSVASTTAFRAWLRDRYETDERLQSAWGSDDATFDTVEIPAHPGPSNGTTMLRAIPDMQPVIDYLRYANTTTASVIAQLASAIKAQPQSPPNIYVSYGYTFEHGQDSIGHFALSSLMRSDVNGFLSPVSYINRGLGGIGGFMGPVHSALVHKIRWIIVDDTRTGIRRSRDGKEIKRPIGLRIENLSKLYRRNIALAAIHNLGYAWADPDGSGNLHDRELWNEFEKLNKAYISAHESVHSATPRPLSLAVVLDENSRLYETNTSRLHASLLLEARDNALRAGVHVKFYTLQDILDRQAAPAKAYLFLNTFHLEERERTLLHTIMNDHDATAIWMYAPGFFGGEGGAKNISETTGMHVLQSKTASGTGSTYAFTGNWLTEGETFGISGDWGPRFYIDDAEADVLARYADGDKVSAAIKFFEGDWASVYICEPMLPLELLREILDILELPILVKPSSRMLGDLVQPVDGALLIHASGTGTRLLDLRGRYDISDFFTPEIGWPKKRSVTLSMQSGETRLLRLRPVPGEVFDEERELEQVPDSEDQ